MIKKLYMIIDKFLTELCRELYSSRLTGIKGIKGLLGRPLCSCKKKGV